MGAPVLRLILAAAFLTSMSWAEEPARPARGALDSHGEALPPGAVARFGSTRFKHTHFVACLAFSPDGRFLATGTHYEGQATLWDASSGQEVRRFTPNWQSVEAIEFTPDGMYVLTGANGNAPALHEVATGKRVRAFSSQARGAAQLVHGGEWVACAEWKHAVCWETATGREVWRIPIAEEDYWTAFSPNGEAVASVGRDGVVKLISWLDGKEFGRLDTGLDSPRDLAHSHDGRWLAIAGGREGGQIWDPASLKRVLVMDREGASGLIWSPDNSLLAVVGHRSTQLHSTRDRWEPIGPPIPAVGGIAFSPDGTRLAFADGQRVRFWSIRSEEVVPAEPGHSERIFALALSGDGRTLASAGWDSDVLVWEASSGRLLKAVPVGWDLTNAVALDGSGETLLSAHKSRLPSVCGGEVFLTAWRSSGPREIASEEVSDVAISPDGARVVTMGWPTVWDAHTGVILIENRKGRGCGWSVAFSSSGRHLVLGGQNGRVLYQGEGWITLNETETLTRLKAMDGSMTAIQDATFACDDAYICSNSWKGPVQVWEVATGSEVCRVAPGPRVWAATWVPTRRWVALACNDSTIRIHDAWAGTEVAILRGHSGDVTSVVASPDGTRLYSGSIDTTILVWDLAAIHAPAARLEDQLDIEAAWAELTNGSSTPAHRAMARFARGGEEAVALLVRRLAIEPAPVVSEELGSCLRGLDASSAEDRERASKRLVELGRKSLPDLQAALSWQLSAEVRARVVAVLDELEPSIAWPDSGEGLRRMRALRVLEAIGSDAAREALAGVAAHPTSLRELQAAERALRR